MQGQRIVFEFNAIAKSASDAWDCVIALLDSVDGQALDVPSPESVSLIRAVIPNTVDPSAFIQKLQELDGVGRADLDAPRMIF